MFEKFDESAQPSEDYVRITANGGGPGCFSQLGRQSGEQILNLDSSCLTPALVLHELLHTLGNSFLFTYTEIMNSLSWVYGQVIRKSVLPFILLLHH